MAQNINYGSEIKNGGTIKSEHVSQFVDAFTAVDAYDINISGSLNIVGTTSGSFIGDGSGLTGITGGGGTGSLTTKAGNIPSSSFQNTGSSGNSLATVTFETPFSSSDYSVAAELETPSYVNYTTKTSITDKTPAGFSVLANTQESIWALLPDSSMNYIAVADTETSIFTIPTSSFGLNTKVGTVPTSSFVPTPSESLNYSASITYATPFSSSDYSLVIEEIGGGTLNPSVVNKTTTGFSINLQFNPQGASISYDYIAAAQGETAVTSSFTLLSATASYVEQAQTASYVEIFPYTGSAIISGSLTVEGDVNTTTITTTPTTVSSLPSGVTGQRSFVTDSTYENLFGEVVTGSGAYTVPVFYNGTQWLIG